MNTTQTKISHLTKQELRVAELVINGKTIKQISERLCISEDTTRSHLMNLYRKMGVNKSTEMFKALLINGLIIITNQELKLLPK